MIRMKALLLPFLLVGFTGALSAQTVFDFDFTAGSTMVTGTIDATPSTLPGAVDTFLATSINATFDASPITLLAPGTDGLPNDNNLISTNGTTFRPTNDGIGFTADGNNYLLNDIDNNNYLSEETGTNSSGQATYGPAQAVTFTAVEAPWEPSDSIAIAGALLFGFQQFRKRRKVAA